MEEENKGSQSKVSELSGYFLAVFLLLLYAQTVALHGLKFAAAASVSCLTGVILWALKYFFSVKNTSDNSLASFHWQLFLLFPLFIPLALPLWLIPFILLCAYLIAISAFGGYSSHIFNPTVLAVVFMLYGYSNIGVLQPSKPFLPSVNGYKAYSAGTPPTIDIREFYSDIDFVCAVRAAYKGVIPNIPGSSFGMVIFLASFLLALATKRGICWWLVAVVSICSFAYFLPQNLGFNISVLGSLIFGIMPSLLLCGVADASSLPKFFKGQVVNAILFGCFAVLMLFYSNEVLAPAYGFLAAQVLTPLASDILGVKNG